ncbi:MAG: glycosyltransferase family 2 protein [Armatimonadota bacterium]|jgi:GT2 family glycosyltransferase
MDGLVSVIIVNYNKRSYSELCVSSLLKTAYEPLEIIAIDNGSTDGTGALLQDLGDACAAAGASYEVILNDSNVGAPAARNQGMAQARGDYIAFLDNDVAVRDVQWLRKLRAALEEADENGICGPKLLFPFEPYHIEFAGCDVSPTGRVHYRGRGAARDAPEFNERREVQCLISAAWLMKAKLIDEIGLMDELFSPAQYEDIDYCYRARHAGYRVLYEPAAEMYHFENVTTDGSADVAFRQVTMRNAVAFKRRWRHVFATEGGPPDRELEWAPLETRPIEQTGVPPLIGAD